MLVQAADGWCDEMNCSVYDLVPYLNGVEVAGCIAADTRAGWVDALKMDERGRPVLEDGEVVVIRQHGRVEVKRKQEGQG